MLDVDQISVTVATRDNFPKRCGDRDIVDRVLAAVLDDPCDRGRSRSEPADTHYADLLGSTAWMSLPREVRRRFSTPLAPGASHVYQGQVVATELSRVGRWLARAACLVGSPLPLVDGATGPAVVVVTPRGAHGAQLWTRCYARSGARAQVIQSVKQFSGPTGLEEDLGYGLTMPLVLSTDDGALVFRSAGYVFKLGAWRLRIPSIVSPGLCEIVHRHDGPARFSFELTLTHPWFGRLVHQRATFVEVRARGDF